MKVYIIAIDWYHCIVRFLREGLLKWHLSRKVIEYLVQKTISNFECFLKLFSFYINCPVNCPTLTQDPHREGLGMRLTWAGVVVDAICIPKGIALVPA